MTLNLRMSSTIWWSSGQITDGKVKKEATIDIREVISPKYLCITIGSDVFIYTALQKFGITWSAGGMPEYWYPLWNTYCPR